MNTSIRYKCQEFLDNRKDLGHKTLNELLLSPSQLQFPFLQHPMILKLMFLVP